MIWYNPNTWFRKAISKKSIEPELNIIQEPYSISDYETNSVKESPIIRCDYCGEKITRECLYERAQGLVYHGKCELAAALDLVERESDTVLLAPMTYDEITELFREGKLKQTGGIPAEQRIDPMMRYELLCHGKTDTYDQEFFLKKNLRQSSNN
ncbi:MAG: hypothetical protein V1870_02400 [Candidatus Aenigmatarchaeota archaeon]